MTKNKKLNNYNEDVEFAQKQINMLKARQNQQTFNMILLVRS